MCIQLSARVGPERWLRSPRGALAHPRDPYGGPPTVVIRMPRQSSQANGESYIVVGNAPGLPSYRTCSRLAAESDPRQDTVRTRNVTPSYQVVARLNPTHLFFPQRNLNSCDPARSRKRIRRPTIATSSPPFNCNATMIRSSTATSESPSCSLSVPGRVMAHRLRQQHQPDARTRRRKAARSPSACTGCQPRIVQQLTVEGPLGQRDRFSDGPRSRDVDAEVV